LDLAYHIVMQQCWDKNIKVIQQPQGRGQHNKPPMVKLIVSIDYNYIHGKDLYQQNSSELEKAIEKVYRYLHDKHII